MLAGESVTNRAVQYQRALFWLLSDQKQAERRASEASLCRVKQMS